MNPYAAVAGALLAVGALVGCSADVARHQATHPVSATSVKPAGATTAARLANVQAVCGRVELAFRAGTLPEAEQNAALATELQGMMDVSDGPSHRLLEPMRRAADAIGASGRKGPSRAQTKALNRAYQHLERTCTRFN